MFKKFIYLEWKQFFRSSSFGISIAMKIIMAFTALYFIAVFLSLGIGGYYILEESMPDENPFQLICKYLIIWVFVDLGIRFFAQKLPVMNIRPLMIVPIKKKKIIHYLIGKTLISFFNFLPLFFFLPFTIVLCVEGYGFSSFLWLLGMTGIIFCNNFINFLSQKKDRIFYAIIALFAVFSALAWWDIFDILPYGQVVFYSMYKSGYTFLIPLVGVAVLYACVFRYLKNNFYLDGIVQKKNTQAKNMELGFLNRFGRVAVFLKNDIRMISRNVRPRRVLWSSVFFLFYGVIFFPNSMEKGVFSVGVILGGIMVSSGFLITFGQMVPAWDSQYYKLLMSQNISYREYLESKWRLMVFATFLSLILATPYFYFGWKIYLMIVAVGVFNMGLNSFVTLLGGAFNKTPIDLTVKTKAFGDAQGFNLTQMLFALPKMFGGVIIFIVPYFIWGYMAGIIALLASGAIGFLCKDFFFNKIVKVYKKEKYKTIAAFSEKK